MAVAENPPVEVPVEPPVEAPEELPIEPPVERTIRTPVMKTDPARPGNSLLLDLSKCRGMPSPADRTRQDFAESCSWQMCTKA